MKRLLPLLLVTVAACARSGSAPSAGSAGAHVPDTLRSQALIDSGNAAFRSGDYDAAARRYASAAAIKPDDPAAYYGLGMALARLGRDDEARGAYARARDLQGRAADSTAHSR